MHVRPPESSILHGSNDTTHVQFRFDLKYTEMWIGMLEVVGAYQFKGIGREMVRAVESVARKLGLRRINLFPLYSSQKFWLKMGYGAHHCTARVLSKTLSTEVALCQKEYTDVAAPTSMAGNNMESQV